MMKDLYLCVFLAVCCRYDCKERKIPAPLLLMGLMGAFAFAVHGFITGSSSLTGFLVGMLPGAAMIGYSRLSGDKMGPADGIMAMVIGIVKPWKNTTAILLVAFLLIFLWAVILLVSRRGNKDTQIPFAPFLLLAAVILWISRHFSV